MTKRAFGSLLLFILSACSGGALQGTADGGAAGAGAAGAGTGSAGASGGTAGASGNATTKTFEFSSAINRDVDVLFMVDNSYGMKPLNDKLVTALPAFFSTLEALPLPNLHLAVVSSDLGAGKFNQDQVMGCRYGGDQGKFQAEPRGTCTGGTLNAGQTFISNVNGRANYAGKLSDVLGCIASLGSGGCGFEHQLGSVLRALGADGHGGAPAENTGFLRNGATLAVVLFTDEDDCSAPLDSDLFDPSSTMVSDPLGPLTSFRCNEFGHLCAGKRPPMSSAAMFTDCVPAEDGRLLRVADVVAGLKGLKADPNKVLVSVIGGPPVPYAVKLGPGTLATDPALWPYIEHSCTETDGTYGDPGVRLSALAQAFGSNGTLDSICSPSFTPALKRIAESIGRKVSNTPCLDDTLRSAPNAVNQPQCTVVGHAYNAMGTVVNTPIPACAGTAADVVCWTAEPNVRCTSGPVLTLRNLTPSDPQTSLTVTCKLAPP
jgi:hypothetical protein